MAGKQVVRKGMIALMLLSLVAFGSAAPVLGQTTIDDGLVNVAIGDVTILEDVDVDVAAQIVANLCAIDLVDAALLVDTVDQSGQSATCTQRGRTGRIIQVTDN